MAANRMGALARILERRDEEAYLLLRVVAGVMFSMHGMQKLFGVLTDHQAAVGTQVWFGAIIEFGAGLAIAAGLCTPWAAFLASGTMAVAYIQFHWKLQFGHGMFLPAINQGELAVVYCFVYLYFAFAGGGRASLDRAIRKVT